MLEIKECVIQKHRFGCGIACIATVLQKEYDEIYKHFGINAEYKGITTKQQFNYLSDHGLDLVLLQQMSWSSVESNNIRVGKPFADIHILSVKIFTDRAIQHAVIMNRKGRMLCPSNGKRMKESDYYMIVDNMGIFYPSNWKFKSTKRR